jgi:hypothetical protein
MVAFRQVPENANPAMDKASGSVPGGTANIAEGSFECEQIRRNNNATK